MAALPANFDSPARVAVSTAETDCVTFFELTSNRKLLFVEHESRKPFFLTIIDSAAALAAIFMGPPDASKDLGETVLASGTNSSIERDTPLEKQEIEIRAWQARLQVKQSQIKQGDAAAKAGFDAELEQ